MHRISVFHNKPSLIKVVYPYRTILVNKLKKNAISLLGVRDDDWGKSNYRPVSIWHSRLSTRIGDTNNNITKHGVLRSGNFQ